MEPIISDKLVKIELVNQVLESRIKEALREFMILPNMEDFVFWPFQDDLEESDSESEYDEVNDWKDAVFEKESVKQAFGDFDDTHPMVLQNSMVDFANSRSGSVDLSEEALNYVGEAAFQLGKIVRDYGIDETGKKVVQTVGTKLHKVSAPTLSYLDDSTRTYRDYLYQKACDVGLNIVDKLGLTPDPAEMIEKSESLGNEHESKLRKSNSSPVIDILGISIGLSPQDVEGSPSLRKRKHKLSANSINNLKSHSAQSSVSDVNFEIPAEQSKLRRSSSLPQIDNSVELLPQQEVDKAHLLRNRKPKSTLSISHSASNLDFKSMSLKIPMTKEPLEDDH
jgi:hypothetical protein